jgi:DNA mismatch repair protein MutS
MFATHLHDLPKLVDERTVDIWHLHVEYDPHTKKLIYDRSLRKGSGSTLYGLEVARAMDLPAEFIEQALENRHRIMGSSKQEEAQSSSWNSTIIRKECEVCKKAIQSDLEVHHIQPRASANQQILADGTHMNEKRNLVVICQKCHDNVHAGTIEIGDLTITSDGPQRSIAMFSPMPKKKEKWSEEEMKTVKETLQTCSSLSLRAIRAYLESKHSIEMSETVLARVKRGAFNG